MNALMDQLLKLSLAEKLQIIELLWDDIAATKEPAAIPEEHKAEIRPRTQEFAADPSIAISEEELWARVERKAG